MTTELSHTISLYESGLRKALVAECADITAFYVAKIEKDPLYSPVERQEWRKGSFSWLFINAVEYWTPIYFREIERLTMARGKQNGKKSSGLDAYSFVRCELSSEDKKAAKIWIAENTRDMGAITHDVVAEGYKLSVSFSSDHDTFTASLTGKPDSLNEYKTLTARHADWVVAVMTVLYKHTVMFRSKVWESEASEDDGWS